MGENILRVKGILHFENNPRPLIIEGVQHIFYPHRQLDTLIHPDQPSKLTFITRNIERDVIESSLKNVIATHKECNETMW
jgi:G3E family GTPase